MVSSVFKFFSSTSKQEAGGRKKERKGAGKAYLAFFPFFQFNSSWQT